ncbi:antibiotic biosynthesis monooxygenase [Bacillus sp. 03113]|uniref:antibiotic biosynthesis monooxygenase family protein n=1 Tax=Bacillus sp. 03113 TaxID=2578211 RepID=UPI001143D8B0|nr:antibiotic biosynthesis monooxygenase [Bacillus sp. 03113]
MIKEHAYLTINPFSRQEFISTIHKAFPYLTSAEGYIGHELLQNYEKPNQFLLVVHWRTIEDHTETFVKSDVFKEWEKLISPYFESEPIVLHYSDVK